MNCREIVKMCSDQAPPFNDYLLLDFRRQKIAQAKDFLDTVFRHNFQLFEGKLQYIGYTVCDPDEQIEYIKNAKILRRCFDINVTTSELVRYMFTFQGETYSIYIRVAFMQNEYVLVAGTKNYPLLPIIERGGIHRISGQTLRIKVLRTPMNFNRNETKMVVTVEGKVYKDIIVTGKIHQKKTTSKKLGGMPIILYNLAVQPLYDVTASYGFEPGEFQLVSEMTDLEAFEYIQIREGVYLRFKRGLMENRDKRRFIISYITCINAYPIFDDIRILYSANCWYYRTIMGKYIDPTSDNMQRLYDNAVKHLETTNTVVDPISRMQLTAANVPVNDIYDLIRQIFFRIDDLIIDYDPRDLYNKKIGTLNQLLAPLVEKINLAQFRVINNKNESLSPQSVASFAARSSQYSNYLIHSEIFRSNPTFQNDNYLLSIGTKCFRTTEEVETRRPARSGHKSSIPRPSLVAHPSRLVVTSLTSISSSSPLVSGDINPYLQIDDNGDILKPAWADEIAHVFD